MTIAEKLRFLAERTEDEKEFYIGGFLYKYQNEELILPWYETEKDCKFFESVLTLDSVLLLDLKLKPQWEFTEDEKVILRNLPDDYQWITRDASDWLYVYTNKPAKTGECWEADMGDMENVTVFNHLFDFIQWSDDEPCEFRKYL